MTQMMKVTDILKSVTGSVDFGDIIGYPGGTDDERRTNLWHDIINSKSKDSGFIHLVNSILDYGFIEGSAIGYYGNEITEGHHRLVAAILLGMDEVPVSRFGRDDFDTNFVDAHDDGESPRVDFLV